MKSIYKLFIIIAVFGFITSVSYSYEKDISLGAGIGRFTVQESEDYNSFSGGIINFYAIGTNIFGKGYTPEIGVSSFFNTSGDYLYSVDAKLRYYAWTHKKFALYGFIGLGYFTDTTDIVTPVYLPVGLGLTHFFSEKVGADLSVGYNVSSPIILVAKLSVLFRVVSFVKDSDKDGLTDADESKYGTDPNNPDTDSDGLFDGKEVNKHNTDPKNKDTDGGGISDGIEVNRDSDPLDKDDDILSINIGDKLILRGIEFDLGKSEITPRSERILGFAYKALEAGENMEIEICGHTDDIGKIADNDKLSLDRANAVKKWFVSRGINSSRITTRGAGSREPLVPNTTDENRQRNRRVEFYRTK
jgi:outer membrane protein OmpA-like peptidoglycan-associated protein